jgi:hypothetical protein
VTRAGRSCAVGIGSVKNVQDDYRLAVLVDPVTHAQVRSTAGGMLPGVFVAQRMADTARVVQQRAGDELRRSNGGLLRQPGELSLRPGTHIELPPGSQAGHAAPASWNKCAKRRRKAASSRPGPSSPDPGSSPKAARSAASRRRHAVDSADSSSSSLCHSSADTSTTGWCPGRATATGPRPASTSSAAAASRSASLRCSSLTPSLCSRQPADRPGHAGTHPETPGSLAADPAVGCAPPIRSTMATPARVLAGSSREQGRPPEP